MPRYVDSMKEGHTPVCALGMQCVQNKLGVSSNPGNFRRSIVLFLARVFYFFLLFFF